MSVNTEEIVGLP